MITVRENKNPVGEFRYGTETDYIGLSSFIKPNWFHRLMLKLFFGVQWIDYKEPKNTDSVVRRGTKVTIPKGKR